MLLLPCVLYLHAQGALSSTVYPICFIYTYDLKGVVLWLTHATAAQATS